jgi:GNAT superfamily N-acetyltransferase
MADGVRVVIKPISEDERAAWDPLWADYLTFYKAALAPDITDTTWQRFHDPAEPMFILGGYVDGRLTGFVHYLFHRSTWAPNAYCYLEDLFVSEEARGLGIGRALIEAVYDKAQQAGASRVHWLTNTSNAQARILYDQVADHLGFIQYRRNF